TCLGPATFTVVAEAAGGGAFDVSVSDNAILPVTEKAFYGWAEGAFYGDFFGSDAINPRITVEIVDGVVVYRYGDASNGEEVIEAGAYPVECNGVLDDAAIEALRQEAHDAFMVLIQERLEQDRDKDGDFVVFPSAFSCSAPGWNDGRAYAKARLCASEAGADVCTAKHQGDCRQKNADAADHLCATADNSILAGDGDFDDCQGGGQVWQNPITVFLDDPCAILGDSPACATDASAAGLLAVDAGKDHACAVRGDQIQCWGSNQYGQLGYGGAVGSAGEHIGNDEVPATVGVIAGVTGVAQIAIGRHHSCLLTADNAIHCWGRNDRGALGNGTTSNTNTPGAPITLPADIPGGVTVADIEAGTGHTCVLLSDNQVRCWGSNRFGQLGNGEVSTTPITDAADATAVNLGSAAAVQQLLLGTHSCVLLDGGEVRCWGSNQYGQLGNGEDFENDADGDGNCVPTNGDICFSVTPTAVDFGGDTVSQLVLGVEHTCAVMSDTTKVRCWGRNDKGQLGVGVGPLENTPDEALDFSPGSVLQIVAGHDHTCVLLDKLQLPDGTELDVRHMRCWGSNNEGQLGYPSTGIVTAAESGIVVIGKGVSSMTAGEFHTCAQLQSGGKRCWGRNGGFGILGYGRTEFTTLLFGALPLKLGDLSLF
ncbi:MAG: hypothetical protein AAGC55_12700, partial [Myxococcota bacterium]